MNDETEGGAQAPPDVSRYAADCDGFEVLNPKPRLSIAPSGDRVTDWTQWDREMGNLTEEPPPANLRIGGLVTGPGGKRGRVVSVGTPKPPKVARAPAAPKPPAGAENARLAALLAEHGIAPAELAASFGASPKFIETVIAGKAKPLPWMFEHVEKIALARLK